MTAPVVIPLWIVLLAAIAFFVVGLLAVLNGIAWFGASAELAKLEHKIIHVSIFERDDANLRRVTGRESNEAGR